jgi:hypothetical protein
MTFALAVVGVVVGLVLFAWLAAVWIAPAVRRRRDASAQAVWQREMDLRGGAKRDSSKYDQAKAIAGWKRAKRQTPTGRVLKASPERKAGRRRGSEAAVVSMDSRRRAGGDGR